MHPLFPTLSGRAWAWLPAGLVCLLALPASAAEPPLPAPVPPLEQRTERITHEDAGSRIDELRVGGQTRRITVQTPSAVPGYEVTPQEQQSQGQAGRSSWRLLRF
jgi:hypothetical protein